MSITQPTTEGPPGLADNAARVAELRQMLRQAKADAEPEETPSRSCFLQLIGGPPRPRRLIDFVEGQPGSGAGILALWLCLQACRGRGELVVIDPFGGFQPTAAVAWGVDARRLLVVSPERPVDALAVTELALRSPAVGAVWARLGAIDGRAFRRLLLAAEAGEAFGALIRSVRHVADPSWGHTQLRVEPLPNDPRTDSPLAVRAKQLRNRHGPVGGEATIAIDWLRGQFDELPADEHQPDRRDAEPDALCLAPRLADTTAEAPPTRAAS